MEDNNKNSGNWNSGIRNTGDSNSGNWNTGDFNRGSGNTGNWNRGHWNSGMFNTDEPTVRMFNSDTGLMRDDISIPSFLNFSLTSWVPESDMTDQEKIDNKDFETSCGYSKKYEYKEAFQKAWDDASESDKALVIALPNFDAKIFEEISGINVNESKPRKMTVSEIAEELGFEIEIVK